MENKITDFLEEYLPYVDFETPTYINMGGCAMFALELSKVLTSMGIEHRIFSLFAKDNDTAGEQKGNIKNFIGNGNVQEPFGVDHVCIEVQGKKFDSEGIVRERLFEGDPIEMNANQLEMLIKKSKNWRRVFNRTDIPIFTAELAKIPERFGTWKPGEYEVDDDQDAKIIDKTTQDGIDNEFVNTLFGRL